MFSFNWRFRLVGLGIMSVVCVVAFNLQYYAGISVSSDVLWLCFFAMLPIAFYIAGRWWLSRDLDDER